MGPMLVGQWKRGRRSVVMVQKYLRLVKPWMFEFRIEITKSLGEPLATRQMAPVFGARVLESDFQKDPVRAEHEFLDELLMPYHFRDLANPTACHSGIPTPAKLFVGDSS